MKHTVRSEDLVAVDEDVQGGSNDTVKMRLKGSDTVGFAKKPNTNTLQRFKPAQANSNTLDKVVYPAKPRSRKLAAAELAINEYLVGRLLHGISNQAQSDMIPKVPQIQLLLEEESDYPDGLVARRRIVGVYSHEIDSLKQCEGLSPTNASPLDLNCRYPSRLGAAEAFVILTADLDATNNLHVTQSREATMIDPGLASLPILNNHGLLDSHNGHVDLARKHPLLKPISIDTLLKAPSMPRDLYHDAELDFDMDRSFLLHQICISQAPEALANAEELGKHRTLQQYLGEYQAGIIAIDGFVKKGLLLDAEKIIQELTKEGAYLTKPLKQFIRADITFLNDRLKEMSKAYQAICRLKDDALKAKPLAEQRVAAAIRSKPVVVLARSSSPELQDPPFLGARPPEVAVALGKSMSRGVLSAQNPNTISPVGSCDENSVLTSQVRIGVEM